MGRVFPMRFQVHSNGKLSALQVGLAAEVQKVQHVLGVGVHLDDL